MEAKVANNYAVAAVSSGFIEGGPWSRERALEFSKLNETTVEFLQDSSSTFVRLENADCIKDYSPQFLSGWANLLVVVDNPLYSNETLLNVHLSEADDWDSHSWMCDGPTGGARVCETPETLTEPEKWQTLGASRANLTCSKSIYTNKTYCDTGKDVLFDVKYCLAQRSPESCRVGASSTLLLVVLACNLIKILCFLWTLWRYNSFPLVTLGDAIASFLRRPDSNTENCGPLEYDLKDWRASDKQKSGRIWKVRHTNGFRTASKKRWLICSLL